MTNNVLYYDIIVIIICPADQINIDGGTLHRDAISPSVDSNPAWDIMDIMNNVKVSSLQIFIPFMC